MSTSTQPVNRFLAFHSLSPWRSRISLYVMEASLSLTGPDAGRYGDANVLAGSEFDPETFDPADSAECAWAVTEALLLSPPDERDTQPVFSDEIRKYIQEMQEDVFDEIVGQSQAAAIGTEWAEMGVVDASFLAVNRHLMEATLAPYVGLLADQEYAAELARDPEYNEWVASRRDDAIEHQLSTMAPDEDPLGP